MNLEIRQYFSTQLKNRVRSAATGDNANIWRAVKVSKNVCLDSLPLNMTLAGLPVTADQRAQKFAEFFHQKVSINVNNATVNSNAVYNGKCKMIVQNRNFMTKNDVMECMSTLKDKKCEGYDRIPVNILYDAREPLLDPLSELFAKVYKTRILHM